ncbi:HesA/MoeB/ThiF family protein, partial [Paracoccus aestuarii]|uniref:HesA/MoeB/ThiF family protein n=1 Tax=Paracoccus aestuarii TaxID=453842 RepID=UPI0030B852D6
VHDAPCAEAGVVGALPGIIGSVMALEAIKHLTGAGQSLRGRMMLFDGLYGESRMIACAADPACPVCGGQSALAPGAPLP